MSRWIGSSDGGSGQGDPPKPISSEQCPRHSKSFIYSRIFRNFHFNQDSDLQNSGLPAAAVVGSCVWSIEGEIGCPVASVSVSQIYDGELLYVRVLPMVMLRYKTLLGAAAPAAWASPT